MATPAPIDRPRGTLDVLPEDCYALAEIQQQLQATFESFAYRHIDVPVIEHSELYLRKSGSEIVGKMYAFTDYGQRRICLRPEFTASVVRAFLHSRSRLPFPARLWYAGPSFRFEKPQKGRYRQFTQVGVELIGASGALADAEVMVLALRCLQALRLAQHRLVLGHIGIAAEFLARLDLDERARVAFIESLESLRKPGKGIKFVRARLNELFPEAEDGADGDDDGQAAVEMMASTSQSDAVAFVSQLLQKMNIELGSGPRPSAGTPGAATAGRPPEEIVDRLLKKLATRGRHAKLEQALEFVLELSEIRGQPDRALADARALLERYGLDQAPLREMEQVVELVGAGANVPDLSLDFSLARGLQYYTGLIFEIYQQGIGSEDQVCGGGRYDGLARTLGAGDEIPALGFSFGLERLKLAREYEGVASPPGRRGAQVVVVPSGPEVAAYAMRVAQALRREGLSVELDVRNRGLRAGLDYVNRARVGHAVVVRADEESAGAFLLRDMGTREQRSYTLAEARAAAVQVRSAQPAVLGNGHAG